jgi:hypothetical protein
LPAEPNVTAVAVIDDIVAIREGTDHRCPVQQVEYEFGEDERFAIAGDELRTGRERDAFQP